MSVNSTSFEPLNAEELESIASTRAAARARFAYVLDEGDDHDPVGEVPGPVDPDNPPMTDEDLIRLRPAEEVAPALVAASLRRKNVLSRESAPETPALPATEQSTRSADDVIQVVEERLKVGKRSVSRGRVRVHTSIVSREVSESVTLHSETVSIDRRAVDRPVSATASDADPFKERTIEMEEFIEEAVVAKSAHLVGEIGLHKDTAERVETVRETLRRTMVDIEDDRIGRTDVKVMGTSGTEIRDGMEVFGSDGVLVGRIARVDGDRIGLRKAGVVGQHQYITRAIVESVADRVTLAVTADEVHARWATA